MEKKGKSEGLLERTARALDIPAPVAGTPRLELTGRLELRMENHQGILAYGDEEIVISGGRLLFKVTGRGLELKAMTASELLITGQIAAVEVA